jgi:hypothetical protein
MKKSVILAIIVGIVCFAVAIIMLARMSNTPEQAPTGSTKKDRIPVNTVCSLGPSAVFKTNDDVTLYMVDIINGDSFAAKNMLSGEFHFSLRDSASVKVLYHGPYQGYVAPDAPQSTRKALSQFEICQVQILDGVHKGRTGWIVDTELRCPTQKDE